MLHVAVLVTTSSECGGPGVRLPMDALADAKAMVSHGCQPIAVSSDSEGEPMEVAQRPHQPCGQQMPEFYCNAPEHISLDELGDAASAGATGDAAEGAAGTAAPPPQILH